MKNLQIAFIGGGNMAEALIAGLIRSGHPQDRLTVTDIRQDRLDSLQQEYGVQVNSNNAVAVSQADVVVLAVKPQMMQKAASGLSDSLKPDATVVSIAAGVSIDSISSYLGNDSAVVRVMPNTPALLGAGMSVLFSGAEPLHRERSEYVMGASGETAWVDREELLHAVTAVSGSGPAYFFLLAEVLQAAGVKLGLSEALAEKLASQTAAGAGKMLAESGRKAEELRHQVTSPGGTTQAALDEMYEKGLPDAVRAGVIAASKRSKELK
ncbi:pyrroline-5-carboxylate reductase [Pseudomonadota bacterium]